MVYVNVILITAAVLAVSATAIIAIASLKFYSFIKPEKTVSSVKPSDYGLEYESVTLQTEDRVSLDAWFVPSKKKTDKVIVVFHGYPFDKGNILPTADFLQEEFNLLFFDFRYLGRSGGSYVSFGFHEQKDAAAAVRYLQERNQTGIGFFGISLGGAVAIMAAKDGKADAVVADSSFASLDSMIEENYANFSVLRRPLAVLTRVIARIAVNVDTSAVSPENSIKGVSVPVMIVHSSNDSEIGVSHAQRLKKAKPEAELWIINQTHHGFTDSAGKEEYHGRVLAFFRESLG